MELPIELWQIIIGYGFAANRKCARVDKLLFHIIKSAYDIIPNKIVILFKSISCEQTVAHEWFVIRQTPQCAKTIYINGSMSISSLYMSKRKAIKLKYIKRNTYYIPFLFDKIMEGQSNIELAYDPHANEILARYC